MTKLRYSPTAFSGPRLTPAAAAVRLVLAAAVLASPAAYAQTAGAAEPTTLQEVKIVGAAERGYDVKSTSTATKTDTLLRDTPQAITVVTRELIRDQAMQSMADVIRYVPGVVTAQGEGNRDTAVLRGNATTGDFFVDGIRDDVQYYRDLYNIDSVEVLKGPNAMIFGRGGSGGVINRVTKQPEWTTIREGALSLGSWESRRASADIGQAINDKVAVRVNAMVEDSGSYRNDVEIKRKGINPTVAIRAGANTSVVLGYEHFRDDRSADRGITSFNGAPVDTDPSTFFGSARLSPTWARVDAFTASIEHDLGNGALLRNRTRYADYDKFYQNVFANSAASVTDGELRLNIAAYNNLTRRKNLFNQTDLTFSVNAGGIKHKLATGLEFGRQQTDNFRTTGSFNGAGTVRVPLANPVFNGPVAFSKSATDADNRSTATVASVYLQDQLEFSPQWQAVVGLRYDRFNVDFTNNRDTSANRTLDITDSKVSPRVGLVYKPIEAVSVYGSYSLAFVPRAGDQLASLTATNSAFEPEKFKNLEIGVKWDIRPNLSATAAVYQLDRNNVMVTDPADPTRSILVPEGQRSKGVELSLGGSVTSQWNVMGGYSYQDSTLTAAQSRTIPAGTTVPQVPTHSLSVWNRYDFSPALGAGLGVVYRDAIYASTSNAVTLPSFTRVDAALYYAISKQYQLQLNVENLFDKRYYASAHSDFNITPGSPRALRVSLNAKF